jgi:hypothetical protein
MVMVRGAASLMTTGLTTLPISDGSMSVMGEARCIVGRWFEV